MIPILAAGFLKVFMTYYSELGSNAAAAMQSSNEAAALLLSTAACCRNRTYTFMDLQNSTAEALQPRYRQATNDIDRVTCKVKTPCLIPEEVYLY